MKKYFYIYLFLISFTIQGQLLSVVSDSEVSADDPEITIGNTTTSSLYQDVTTGTLTLSHTCAANTEMLVVTIVAYETVSISATSATYNSVSMTESIASWTGGAVDGAVYIYTLASPTTGSAQDIVFSFTNANLNEAAMTAIDLEVSSGTISVDASSTVNDITTGNPTVDITTVAANTVIIDAMFTKANNPYSVGTGQTEVSAVDLGSNSSGTSYKFETSSGTKTMFWVNGGSDELAKSGAVSFKSSN